VLAGRLEDAPACSKTLSPSIWFEISIEAYSSVTS
jgi:hypothetical protein